jgi:hypothetical protein
MKFSKELIAALPWERSLTLALPPTGEFFPSRVEAIAARGTENEYLNQLRAQLEVGRPPSRSEVVPVPRSSGVSRPALDVAVGDRVILTALALRVIELLEPYKHVAGLDLQVGSLPVAARREFERRPMEESHAGAMAIAVTDIASFYEYVDHETLAQEVVDLTADVELSAAVREALGELQERDIGLPQGPRGSDVFADLYLSQVDRRLARAGWAAYRLRDEFLVPVADKDEGRRALLDLEAELRAIGLSLNPAKTATWDRSAYIAGVEQLEEQLREAIVEQGSESDAYAFDSEAIENADWSDLDQDRLEQLCSAALAASGDQPISVTNHVLTETLPGLGAVDSAVPLDHLSELVAEFPHLTREIAIYLRLLKDGEHASRVVSEIQALLLGGMFIYPWTIGWLFDVLARTDQDLSPELDSHLERALIADELPWFALGRAVIALARDGAMPDQGTIDRLFVRATDSGRADIAWAVRDSNPPWRKAFESSIGPDQPLLLATMRPRRARRQRRSGPTKR